MSTVQHRLMQAMDRAGLSQAELARRLNIAQPTVNTFLKSRQEEWKSLIRAARALDVRPEWLQFGDGPMSENDTFTPPKDVASSAMALTELGPGYLDIGGLEWVSIPRFDAALSAGPGAIVSPNAPPLGYQLLESQWLRAISRATPDHLAVVRVDGDSMAPTLHDGDWVLVDRSQTRLNREGVYALAVNDACWVKRITLNLRDKLVQVVSDNPAYPLQELPEDDLTILGRIVWIVGRRV